MKLCRYPRSKTSFLGITKLIRTVCTCLTFAGAINVSGAMAQEGDYTKTAYEEKSGAFAGSVSIMVEGRPHTVTYYEGENGEALYQGDIIIGPSTSLQSLTDGVSLQNLKSEILFGLARRNIETRWPESVVRYSVSPDLDNRARVFSAIAEWEAATPIRFVEISSPTGNYVEFVPGTGCSSAVGMVGGRQVIRLAPECSTGNTIHEIGHTIGLHHEQAREDRASNVIVFRDNIVAGRVGNFSQDPFNFEDIGKYCYESIMHYGPYAFSKKPGILKTIETNPAGIRIGQRDGLADCDIAAVREIYETFADEPVSRFEGVLELIPAGCMQQGKCYLKNDITYTDPSNVRWRAGKWIEGQPETEQTGTTDGASIPAWAQTIIGAPFNEQYLLAAVVHDHYCYKENRVRNWRQTHRMFHNALISLNVPSIKSKIMYAAVYVGGPKWLKLVPGQDCGPNCIYDAISNKSGFIEKSGEYLVFRDSEYTTMEFQNNLDILTKLIEDNPQISITEIESVVRQLKPNDRFYNSAEAHRVLGADDPFLKTEIE